MKDKYIQHVNGVEAVLSLFFAERLLDRLVNVILECPLETKTNSAALQCTSSTIFTSSHV